MSESDIWMLRAGGNIIGPVSTEDINDKIKAHQITGIDEVARPCSPWYYIRDVNQFFETLERVDLVRNENSTNSKTNQSGTMTGSDNKTVTLTAQEDIDKTMEMVDLIKLDNTEPLNAKLEASNLENVDDEKSLDALNNLDKYEANKKRKGIKGFFLIGIIALTITGLFLYQKELIKPPRFEKVDALKEARMRFQTGDYRQALMSMKVRAKSGKSLFELQAPYAALLLLKEKNTDAALQALIKIEDKNTAEWKNLRGLIKFYKEDYSNAEKDFLVVASTDQFYTPAMTNLGLLSRLKKDWSSSKNYFESSYSKGAPTDLAAFLFAESWIKESMAKGQLGELKKVDAFLLNHLTLASSYAIELRFLKIWLKQLQGFAIDEEIKALFKLDPYVPEDRVENLYTYQFGFKDFDYICNDLNGAQNSNNAVAAAVSLCFAISGEDRKSLTLVNGFLEIYPNDANLLALKTYVLDSLDEIEQASLSLSEALISNDTNQKIFPLYIQAHFCQRRGDYKCSAKFWQKILSSETKSASAYAGLGRAYFEVGAKDKSKDLLKKAGSLNPNLKSYLKLQQLMKSVNK